jgi:predicted acetyltransferase
MVHGVAAVPDARRHGIGTAVTLRSLQLAREVSATVGVLQASSMGQGPYRRLGFVQVASYGRFVRTLPGQGLDASMAIE